MDLYVGFNTRRTVIEKSFFGQKKEESKLIQVPKTGKTLMADELRYQSFPPGAIDDLLYKRYRLVRNSNPYFMTTVMLTEKSKGLTKITITDFDHFYRDVDIELDFDFFSDRIWNRGCTKNCLVHLNKLYIVIEKLMIIVDLVNIKVSTVKLPNNIKTIAGVSPNNRYLILNNFASFSSIRIGTSLYDTETLQIIDIKIKTNGHLVFLDDETILYTEGREIKFYSLRLNKELMIYTDNRYSNFKKSIGLTRSQVKPTFVGEINGEISFGKVNGRKMYYTVDSYDHKREHLKNLNDLLVIGGKAYLLSIDEDNYRQLVRDGDHILLSSKTGKNTLPKPENSFQAISHHFLLQSTQSINIEEDDYFSSFFPDMSPVEFYAIDGFTYLAKYYTITGLLAKNYDLGSFQELVSRFLPFIGNNAIHKLYDYLRLDPKERPETKKDFRNFIIILTLLD